MASAHERCKLILVDAVHQAFERLLADAHGVLKARAIKEDLSQHSPTQFEEDVYEALCVAARATRFEGKIELVSGHKFPDIIVGERYGIEVKTSKSQGWKSLGNSVMETTRVLGVERVYLYFAKLGRPCEFRYRLYQDCLSEVAVTHSPRYLINMELQEGSSIFDKIGISYDSLRAKDTPIPDLVRYYRSQAKPGEELWWMDTRQQEEHNMLPVVKLWTNLEKEERHRLRVEAFVRFPEILGSSSKKFNQLASWLITRQGIIDTSLRDRFSAGGKEDLLIAGTCYAQCPKILALFYRLLPEILRHISEAKIQDISLYWKVIPVKNDARSKVLTWQRNILLEASSHHGLVRHMLDAVEAS